jgi:hypothetical protein
MRKTVVVHQPAIADRTVNNFDFRAVHVGSPKKHHGKRELAYRQITATVKRRLSSESDSSASVESDRSLYKLN